MKEEIDPTDSTKPEMSRGAFVGISAAAAASAATVAKAAAQGMEFGKTHPPIVAEDDPNIVVEHLKLRRPDGEIAAYAASPKSSTRPVVPGIVVAMHVWGVDTSIRDVVRRLAREGYVTIAPDLYSRFDPPSGDGVSDISVFRPFAGRLQNEQVDGDMRAAALWVRSRQANAKIGVTGFCMGGTIALRQAISNGDVFTADCAFYGAVQDVNPDKVHMPICGNYGERDRGIPADDVRAFRKALLVPNDIVVYPSAGHAFFDDQRTAFVPSAAVDAWKRTLAFFTKYLKS